MEDSHGSAPQAVEDRVESQRVVSASGRWSSMAKKLRPGFRSFST